MATDNKQTTLEPCPFCGVVPAMQSHTQEDEMDEGRYLYFIECASPACPVGYVSTGGPHRTPRDAAKRWNTRVSADSAAPVVDDNLVRLIVNAVSLTVERVEGGCSLNVKRADELVREVLRDAAASPAAPQEDALVDEVQHRMDQVVEAAVEWHQAGREGAEWFDAAEELSNAVSSLLEIRSKPPTAPASLLPVTGETKDLDTLELIERDVNDMRETPDPEPGVDALKRWLS